MTDMRGVVLAGGLGTRLHPMTRIVNKHLLPVYDRPMVFHPLASIRSAGIDEVCLVVGGRGPDEFRELLGEGEEWGFTRFEYRRQAGEGGIADALACAHEFVGEAPSLVVLGDNILEDTLQGFAEEFLQGEAEAMVLLTEVEDPERFGVPEFDAAGAIARIVEKPAVPQSSYAVIGAYMYRPGVFDIIDSLEPSARGEIEITDLNNRFASAGTLAHGILEGMWGDAGTVEGLYRASTLVREMRMRSSAAAGRLG